MTILVASTGKQYTGIDAEQTLRAVKDDSGPFVAAQSFEDWMAKTAHYAKHVFQVPISDGHASNNATKARQLVDDLAAGGLITIIAD